MQPMCGFANLLDSFFNCKVPQYAVAFLPAVLQPQGSAFAYGYARQCFTALKDGQGGQVALLRMANDILDILVMQEKPPKVGMSIVVAALCA
jgi:hypothetical protein